MRLYRAIALVLAVSFAVTGVVFLVAPGEVGALLDRLGIAVGSVLPAADLESGLFRALAVAYMYLVTLLAWMMFTRPAEPLWPTLLAHAKLASAAISLVLFVSHRPYVVYLVNGLVDGLLGATALVLRRQAARGRDREQAGEGQHEHPPVPA